MEPSLLIVAGIAVFGSGGAAWAGTKASLNGTRSRVGRIESRVDEEIPQLRDTLQKIDVRTARMEEKMEVARLLRKSETEGV